MRLLCTVMSSLHMLVLELRMVVDSLVSDLSCRITFAITTNAALGHVRHLYVLAVRFQAAYIPCSNVNRVLSLFCVA